MLKRILRVVTLLALLGLGLMGLSEKMYSHDSTSLTTDERHDDSYGGPFGGGVVAVALFVAAASGLEVIRVRRNKQQ